MQTSKKKPSVLFLLLGAVLAGYLGYLIGGAWTDGIEFNAFMSKFNEVCSAPFENYFNEYTVKAVAIAIGVYAMAIIMYYTSQRNMMPGKEFGTAKLESPQKVNKILMDKDEKRNLERNLTARVPFIRQSQSGKEELRSIVRI